MQALPLPSSAWVPTRYTPWLSWTLAGASMSYFRDGRLVWQGRRRRRRRERGRERERAEGEGTNRVEKEGRVRKGRRKGSKLSFWWWQKGSIEERIAFDLTDAFDSPKSVAISPLFHEFPEFARKSRSFRKTDVAIFFANDYCCLSLGNDFNHSLIIISCCISELDTKQCLIARCVTLVICCHVFARAVHL